MGGRTGISNTAFRVTIVDVTFFGHVSVFLISRLT